MPISIVRLHSPPDTIEVRLSHVYQSQYRLISVVSSAFPRSSQNRQAGNLTPRTINSLTAIAAEHGHEGEEEEWEREMNGWRNSDDVFVLFETP